jgi:hypothetical protein
MVKVLPTPAAAPKKTVNLPRLFSGASDTLHLQNPIVSCVYYVPHFIATSCQTTKKASLASYLLRQESYSGGFSLAKMAD